MRLSGTKRFVPRPGRAFRNGNLALLLAAASWPVCAQNPRTALEADTWRLETSGEAGQAAERLREATASTNASPDALRTLAEFLDRHHDPAARQAYERLSSALGRTGAPREQRAEVARRLAVL